MYNSKCAGSIYGHGCTASKIGRILLVVGGFNWGLVGVAMLTNSDVNAWNLVHLVVGTVPSLEAVVYLLVGVAAVMKLVGCKCKKCTAACDSCRADSKDKGSM